MNSLRKTVLFIVGMLFFISGVNVWADGGVLYLNSYHRGYRWSDEIYRGFSEVIGGRNPGIKIKQEFMDTKRLAYEQVEDTFADNIKSKYPSNSYDIVAACDDSALRFVMENYESLFIGKPVIFCGVNDYKPNDILEIPNLAGQITGIVELTDFKLLYQAAKEIYPQAKKVYCLVDNSETGSGYRRDIVEQLVKELGIDVEFLDGSECTSNEVVTAISSIPRNSIVIANVWCHDRTQQSVDPAEFVQRLCKVSPAPVFSTYLIEDFKGPMGCYAVEAELLGRQFGELVSRILRGTKVADIPVVSSGYTRFVFDLDVLSEWQVPLAKLPSGADFIGEMVYSEVESMPGRIELYSWEMSWLKENDKIKCGIYDLPPFMIPGEPAQGYCVDLLNSIAHKLGVEIEYKELPKGKEFDSGFDLPDMALCIEKYERDARLYDYSYPWMKVKYTLFSHADRTLLFYSGLGSLADKTIAVESGAQISSLLAEQYPEIKLLQVESIEECFNAISSGQVDGCICSYLPAVYIARSHGYSDIAMVSEIKEFSDNNYYLAVKGEKAILNNIMKKVLSSLPENELVNLKNKYRIETLTVNSISYLTFAIWSVFALVFIAVVLFVFSLYLRRLRQQSQQEQDNLRITFESLHDAVIIIDLNGTIMQMNSAAQKILKITDGPGKSVVSIFDYVSEDQVSIRQVCNCIMQADSEYRFKANGRVVLADDEVIHVSLGVTMVVGGTSGLYGAVLVIRDITSSYLIQQQLRIVEQERELILSNIPVGICFLDNDFRILKINRQMEKYFGRPAPEVCGMKCHKAWFNRSKACTDCVARQAAESLKVCKGRPPYMTDDSVCEMVVVPIIEDGKLTGLLEMMIDITEYTRVRKELESAYSKLKSHSVKLVSLVEERSQELLKSNRELNAALNELKTAQSILILSEKMAALGQLIAGIAHEINTPLGAIGSSGENISSCMLSVIDNMHNLAQWLRGEDGSQIAGLLSESLSLPVDNIMSTREYRARRRKIETQLQSAGVVYYSEIASYITDSHLGDNWQEYLDLFKEPDILDKLNVIIRIHDIINSCNTIETAIQKASRIVRALKNYIHAGSDDGKLQEEKKQIDIRVCLETVLTLFHNKLKNGIELELEFEDVPEIYAYSDELNQVWTNLIQNAIYAMNGKGKLIIRITNSAEGISVAIVDNGCGMPQGVKDRMFEPLYTTKPVGEGTGLGMDIVRRIVVDDHGGNIEVESAPGEGTSIIVWLPVGVPQETEEHIKV